MTDRWPDTDNRIFVPKVTRLVRDRREPARMPPGSAKNPQTAPLQPETEHR